MKLGFLGCGKMASALLGGVIKASIASPSEITVSDKIPAATSAAEKAFGVKVASGNQDLVTFSDVIFLCVKPNDALSALESLKAELSGKLVISIVTGLSLQKLQEAAGTEARIVRVMPNTPALIGEGAAAIARGEGVTEEDIAFVTRVFSSVGTAVEVKESLLDAVTGLSGSGPAYVYLMIEALADGGVRVGLPRDLALKLAAQTVVGAAQMVLQTGLHPAVLKDQVTSPGGTTIAALETLEEAAVRAAFIRAVGAATDRSIELGA